EILPLGEFTNEGDYFEGDLEKEPTPKLAIDGGYSFNNNAKRSQGQSGKYLHQALDLKTTFFDAIFKYSGWAYQVEYMRLDVDNPITLKVDEDPIYAFKGFGYNHQLSYLIDQ